MGASLSLIPHPHKTGYTYAKHGTEEKRSCVLGGIQYWRYPFRRYTLSTVHLARDPVLAVRFGCNRELAVYFRR